MCTRVCVLMCVLDIVECAVGVWGHWTWKEMQRSHSMYWRDQRDCHIMATYMRLYSLLFSQQILV